MKKILVTGGAGFIGSHLTAELLDRGHIVTVLDNFSTGKRENIAPFLDRQGFRLITGDIRDTGTCLEAADGAECIFHEAALGSVPRSIKDPATTAAVNVSGFVNMLCAAREKGVKRFIYASSSSVYGDCADSPKVEERTGVPLSPYAVSKSADELFAANFSLICGMECVGLRYFNVFGPRQSPDGPYAAVIPRFIASLAAHRPPTINGDGSFSRDFTFVRDVVHANMLAMAVRFDQPGHLVCNIAGHSETSILELFTTIRDLSAAFDPAIRQIEPLFGPVRAGDIPHSLASIALAEKMLGYLPEFTVRRGLKETIRSHFAIG